MGAPPKLRGPQLIGGGLRGHGIPRPRHAGAAGSLYAASDSGRISVDAPGTRGAQ
jgi:hypothetical protein